MEKLIITGASGLLGSKIVKLAKKATPTFLLTSAKRS